MNPKYLILSLVVVLFFSGCITTKQSSLKLPDSFITIQSPIIGVKTDRCPSGYVLTGNDIITEKDCGALNGIAPCIRIPLSLQDDNLSDKLDCGSEIGKAYCRIEMDNEVIIKEGCFETGLNAITSYSERPVDLTKTHTFTICCSATDSNEGFDTCKSFILEKVC